jgi:hypothetical protein
MLPRELFASLRHATARGNNPLYTSCIPHVSLWELLT